MSSVKTAQRLVPAALAAYIARSALRSSSGPAAVVATPIEARSDRRLPSSITGADNTEKMRSTNASMSPTSTPRIANSSPPNLATMSPARRALRRRSPQISSSRSPAAWPSESLTCLNSSRSRKATRAGAPAASVSAMRCSNRPRFGRPVKESSNASRWRWSSRRRRRPARSSRPSSAVKPTTNSAITSTVPIQENRSLRVATSRLPSAAARNESRRSSIAGSTTTSIASARSKSRARSSANSSSMAGWSREKDERAGAAPRLPLSRRRDSSTCILCSVIESSAWTASGTRRRAVASHSSALTRLARASTPTSAS